MVFVFIAAGRESIEYIVSSGAYRRLLDFIHLALQLPTVSPAHNLPLFITSSHVFVYFAILVYFV